MQTLPVGWADMFSSAHKTEYKLQIAGVEYGSDHIIGTPIITKPLLEKPAIGRACSATLSVTIIPYSSGVIPKAARVHLYCRLSDADGNYTDWIPQGRYYVSSRSGKTNVTLTCRDDMLKGGVTYIDKSTLEWPAAQTDIVKEICTLMDVELDERTVLLEGSDYRVDDIDSDALMTEILGYIGACNGGNWIITETGKLRLIRLLSADKTPAQDVSATYNGYTDVGDAVTITKITMTDSGDTEFSAGDNTGTELSIECPYANQNIAYALCNSTDGLLYGVVYQPFSIDKAYLNPACELGDTISVQTKSGSTISVILYSITSNCNVGFTSAISANVEDETEDEYPYQTAQELANSRSVKTNKNYYGNTINKYTGFRSALENGAYGQFNADGIEFVDENGKRCFYYDREAATFIIDGTLGANAIFTNMLYAESGDVSELTVDRLSTNRHIKKFLLNDTSDDNFIRIEGYTMQFVTATPSGLYNRIKTEDNVWIVTEDLKYINCEAQGNTSYVQAQNRYGDLLYWEKDISTATIDENGYPYIDGVQVFTTTEKTDYPVHVYLYDEVVQAEYKFMEDSSGNDGDYAPVQIWGAGSGYGDNGKGYIKKESDAFEIGYTTRSSVSEKLSFNDDGWVDVDKMRKPISFDFSNIANGSFTETIDGGAEATYKVGFDKEGRITKITDENGHITEVKW